MRAAIISLLLTAALGSPLPKEANEYSHPRIFEDVEVKRDETESKFSPGYPLVRYFKSADVEEAKRDETESKFSNGYPIVRYFKSA
ncbi:hypothetical protein TI39_contig948g00006, partial [Zymoseptoria brevis]